MRRTGLVAALGLAVLIAGCGSSAKNTNHPPTTAPPGGTSGSTAPGSTSGPSGSAGTMASTGLVGTMGPPSSGKYNATSATVLAHIEAGLVKYLTSKGFTGVTASCSGVNPSTATCTVAGTNSSGQNSSAVLTISVNQTTGQLRIIHASGAMASTGSPGTMGPPSSGTYSASNPTVINHIDALLVHFFTTKGFSDVVVNCEPVNSSTVNCTASGTNSSGARSTAVLTVAVNRTTGLLRIVHVQTVSTNPGAMSHTGPAGTMGRASAGLYSADNPTVLQHIANVLAHFFAAKGFFNVRTRCAGVNPSIALCRVAGTNRAGRRSSAIVTITVNRRTGALRIVHVS